MVNAFGSLCSGPKESWQSGSPLIIPSNMNIAAWTAHGSTKSGNLQLQRTRILPHAPPRCPRCHTGTGKNIIILVNDYGLVPLTFPLPPGGSQGFKTRFYMKNDQGFEDKDHFLPINFRRYLRGYAYPPTGLSKLKGSRPSLLPWRRLRK